MNLKSQAWDLRFPEGSTPYRTVQFSGAATLFEQAVEEIELRLLMADGGSRILKIQNRKSAIANPEFDSLSTWVEKERARLKTELCDKPAQSTPKG